MKSYLSYILVLMSVMLCACSKQVEHTAPPIFPEDSVAMMSSYGVNTLVSDSGVIKYRIVAEEWLVNQNINPSRWIFEKGLFLEQFDEKFHVQSYIQCDTAYYYDTSKIWELRSRVKILTMDGIRFTSNELFWDEGKHELYSNTYSHIITPDRELEGSYFRSDEQMTKYYISNTKGSFTREDLAGDDSLKNAPLQDREMMRPPVVPFPQH